MNLANGRVCTFGIINTKGCCNVRCEKKDIQSCYTNVFRRCAALVEGATLSHMNSNLASSKNTEGTEAHQDRVQVGRLANNATHLRQ